MVAIPITLSAISTVVEFTIVSVPSTYKSPLILTVPVLSPTTPGSIIKLDGPAIVAVLLTPLRTDIPIPVDINLSVILNDVAVIVPDILIPPVPVMLLLLRSKLPPSCGVVSPTISVVIPVRLV